MNWSPEQPPRRRHRLPASVSCWLNWNPCGLEVDAADVRAACEAREAVAPEGRPAAVHETREVRRVLDRVDVRDRDVGTGPRGAAIGGVLLPQAGDTAGAVPPGDHQCTARVE